MIFHLVAKVLAPNHIHMGIDNFELKCIIMNEKVKTMTFSNSLENNSMR